MHMHAHILFSAKNISCNCHVFRLPGPTALLLHTFVLRPIRIPGKLSWVTISQLGNCAHCFISATSSFLVVTCTSCAPRFPSSVADPSILPKKVLLTNCYSFLWSLSSFLFFLTLLTLGRISPWPPSLPSWHLWVPNITLILMEKLKRVMPDL